MHRSCATITKAKGITVKEKLPETMILIVDDNAQRPVGAATCASAHKPPALARAVRQNTLR
jgi:hypothetical protein